MTDLLELLNDAVGEVEPGFGPQEIMRRVRRRRRSRRVAAGVALITVTASVVAFAVFNGKTTAHRVRVVSPASTTPDVLVFDEAGGLLSVDVTTHVVRYDPIYGWKGGDPPFDSLRVDNDVVVGWGDVYAAPLSGAPAKKLGTGVFVPAVEPGAVWLTSYGKVQTPTERLVDMNGRVIMEGPTPIQSGSSSSVSAITGIPGGLVLQTPTGLDIWDARTARITRHLGTTAGSAAPAFGSLLAWCDQCNQSLELSDLASGVTRSIALKLDGASLDLSHFVFSPDGTQLAIPTSLDAAAPTGPTAKVLIVNVSTGQVTNQIDSRERYASIAWSPDSQRIYITAMFGGGEILVHDQRTKTTRDLGPAPGGADRYRLSTVITQDDAAQLPTPIAGTAATCPLIHPPTYPSTYPKNGEACSYHY